MDTKAEFFSKLEALSNSSDEEEDKNTLKDLVFKKDISTLFSAPSLISSRTYPPRRGRSESTGISKSKIAFQRTTSAPISSTTSTPFTSKEAPQIPKITRKSSLLRYDISSSITPEQSFNSEFPPTDERPVERRTVSNPTIGSVVMSNSSGVKAMLKSKPGKEATKSKKAPKRKASEISLVPEKERIFQDKVIYWIPADENSPSRRNRILKSRNHGAIWTKEWTATVTHVVVEGNITYLQVLDYLRHNFHITDLPSNIILVNDNYPNDCANNKHLFNPDQPQYRVKGHQEVLDKSIVRPPTPEPEPSDESFQIKEGGPKRRDARPPSPTPGRDLTQSTGRAVSVSPVRGETSATVDGNIVESPKEIAQVQDVQYVSFGNDLDEILAHEKTNAHLPFDNEDESNDRPSSSGSMEESDQSGSEGERELAAKRKKQKNSKSKKTSKDSFNQEGFSCMNTGTAIPLESNPNRKTIEILQQMADYYDRIKDEWRLRAYRRAIGVLKKQSAKISTFDEANDLPFIGDRLASKIEEIVLTNRLRRLDNANLESSDRVLQIFTKVYGAGPHQADKWISAGYKTLEDLRTKALLTTNQRIGVEHYDDFGTRIPRDEVTALGDVVQTAAAEIDSAVEVIIGGSYRRGAATSGDIDCLITKRGTTSTGDLKKFLEKLVADLIDSGFLVAALAVPSDRSDGGSKWHGACVLPGVTNPIWRRIDLLLVPETEYGAALIYFTGDDIFNRSIRLLASKKNMRLNQRGLYKDVMRGPHRVKLNEGMLVEGADEKKIFAILGVPWILPHQRIMH